MIRVRFAPSPTGYLHVGGARTALFNWLFARRHGGIFVLRIEDTDVERSSPEMVEGILDGLRWLGLDWDEGPKIGGPCGPYFQSGRLDRYRAAASQLVASGGAYYCYCTPELLKAKRRRGGAGGPRVALRSDLPPAHRGTRWPRCERQGKPRAVRFRVPDGPIRFDDLVHGPIEFDGAEIEDFVVLRSDGHPTYHLSVVSDDVDMRMTHVVRGDDHISNTPKQLVLYQALGAPVPQFAHVPLILGPDKKRLSKRHGATSVMEYARQGYAPEAMVNFLALLGWSPGGDQEVFTREELIDRFSLEGISGGSAVFNPEKLDWFSQQHLLRLAPHELAARMKPWLEAEGLWDEAYLGDRHAWFFAVLELIKPRVKKLEDVLSVGRFFFTDAVEYDAEAVAKHLGDRAIAGHLTAVDKAFARLAAFDTASTEAALARDGGRAWHHSAPSSFTPSAWPSPARPSVPACSRSCLSSGASGRMRDSWRPRASRPARGTPRRTRTGLSIRRQNGGLVRRRGLRICLEPLLEWAVVARLPPARNGIPVAAYLPAHGLTRVREEETVAKEDRGFASMDRGKQREIASKGGRAAHQKRTAHEWTSEEARAAGRKGGVASHQRKHQRIGPSRASASMPAIETCWARAARPT